MERARRDAEVLREKYEDLYNFAPVGYFTVDTAGRVLEANLTGCRLLRIVREKILGRRFQSFLHQSSIPVFLAFIDNALRHEQMQTCELELLRGEATPVFIRVDGTGVRGTEPGTSRVRMSISDVTARKKEENDLRESEERFRTLARNLPGIVYRLYVTPEGNRMEFFNDQVPVLTGYTQKELKSGKVCSIDSFILPEDRARVLAAVEEAILQNKPFEVEYRFRHKSGRICTYVERGRPAVNHGGTVVSIDGIILDVTERRRMQEEVRKSREHYRQLVENISDVILTIDLQGIIRYVSPVIGRLYGYSPEEVTGKHFSLFVHPDDLPRVSEIFARRDDGECSENVFRILTREGKERNIRVTETPILTEGTVTGFNYVMADITDRVMAEKALRESEEFNRGLVENLPDFIVIYDDKGIIRYANAAALNSIGLPAGQVIGTYGPAYIVGAQRDDVEQNLKRRFSGENLNPYEVEILTGHDHNTTVILRGSRITYMNEPCVLLVMTDITDRKRTEEAMIESEKRYRVLFEESPVSLWEEDISAVKSWIDAKHEEGVKDISGHFATHPDDLIACTRMVKVNKINAATRAMYGVESEEPFSQGIGPIFTGDSYAAFRDEIVSFASGALEFHGESINCRLNGEAMNILIRCSIVPGYESTWQKVLVSIMDITDQVGAENALRQANKKLNLLSGITRHDILNQVAILEGYLELAGDAEKSPEVKEYFGHLYQAVKTIQHQIEFTREYQEIGVNASTWQNIRDLVTAAAKAFDLSQVTLTVTCSGAEIFADPLLLKVFYNLIDNSLRYAPPFTTITVTCHETGKEMTIVFADDGVGIPPEDKAHLFEHGFGKHTGLGLFLSREILAITGISIAENGEPGKGARFVISVPKGAYRGFGKPDTR
nr:PAS domain S-box protein [Methanolinea mesophila]